jgi:Ca2+-binding RTX toxin-like protein
MPLLARPVIPALKSGNAEADRLAADRMARHSRAASLASSRRSAPLRGGAGVFVSTGVGNISNHTITFGDGTADSVSVGRSSSNDKIIAGNGNNDSITISAAGTRGDTIITGLGSFDTVTVGAHIDHDTFGFALGTGVTTSSQIVGMVTLGLFRRRVMIR